MLRIYPLWVYSQEKEGCHDDDRRQVRARDRGHDLCVVRRPRREEAERGGRRHGVRQLRDGASGGVPRSRDRPRDARRRGRGDRLHRPGSADVTVGHRGRGPRPRRRRRRPATADDRGHLADRPGGRAGHGPRIPVHRLAVVVARAGHTGRAVVRAPLPPCHADQPAPRRGHDGHPHHGGDARRLPLVRGRADLRRRGSGGHDDDVQPHRPAGFRHRPHLLRGRDGHHHLRAGRPLLRGPRQAPERRGAARPAGTGRQGRRRAARRTRGAHQHRRARGRRPLRGPSRREDRNRRHRRGGCLGRRRFVADRREHPRGGGGRRRRHGGDRQRGAAGSWSRRPGSATTRRWPRSPAW